MRLSFDRLSHTLYQEVYKSDCPLLVAMPTRFLTVEADFQLLCGGGPVR